MKPLLMKQVQVGLALLAGAVALGTAWDRLGEGFGDVFLMLGIQASLILYALGGWIYLYLNSDGGAGRPFRTFCLSLLILGLLSGANIFMAHHFYSLRELVRSF